jgi:hypothetical protein
LIYTGAMVELEINQAGNLPQQPPEPGLLLVLTSLVQICAFMVFATFGCTGIFAATDWYRAVASGNWVFIATYLTWEQYRAVFRANRLAAENMTRLLKLQTLLLGLLLLVLLFRSVFAPDPLIHYITLTLLGLLFSVNSAWLSHLWKRQLQHTSAIERPAAAWRLSLKEILLAITAASCVLAGSSYLVPRDQPRMGEHVPANACPFALPAAARDVSFCYSQRGELAYEFTIDEGGAQEWAASLDLFLMQPISSTFTMPRYGRMHPSLKQNSGTRISQGWQTAGYVDGRQVIIAYDQIAERAYYFTEAP